MSAEPHETFFPKNLSIAVTNFPSGAEFVRRLAAFGPQVVWRKRLGRYTLTLTKARTAAQESDQASRYCVANYKDPR